MAHTFGGKHTFETGVYDNGGLMSYTDEIEIYDNNDICPFMDYEMLAQWQFYFQDGRCKVRHARISARCGRVSRRDHGRWISAPRSRQDQG